MEKELPINLVSKSPPRVRFSKSDRILMGLFAAGLSALLVAASLLTPSPTGMGTHQQLGLPPCTTLALFGTRCPGCGMTTSWAYALDGKFSEALKANTGGVILCATAVFCIPLLSVIAYRGIGTYRGWFAKVAITFTILALLVATAEWVIRLIRL